MGGGLMQLVAYGAQDIYLTGNPQITFFKVVYRRHTNFSMEAIEQTFNGNPGFGKKVSCTISRNGDLIHRVYLQTTLPEVDLSSDPNVSPITGQPNLREFNWVNWVGHQLIKNVEVEIGGQRIDKHYGEWLHLWNELTQQSGHQEGYARMCGNVTLLVTPNGGAGTATNGDAAGFADGGAAHVFPETQLYIPLQFWFCRNPGLALPLIALQYHEVKINVEFNDLNNCAQGNTGNADGLRNRSGRADLAADSLAGNTNHLLNFTNNMSDFSLKDTALFVDYIYLDTDERRRFAQVSHEYLIEQLQFTGEESITSKNSKIKLNFNHPVKELVWVVQPNNNIIPGNKQFFNFTDHVDTTFITGEAMDPLGLGMSSSLDLGLGILSEGAGTYFEGGWGDYSYNTLGGADGPNPINKFDVGKNCVEKAKLQLNGHDRFQERKGDYFNYVQPYQHHSQTPAVGVNVYSFGLKPEEHQPSGTCNFSRIDNATLQLTVTDETVKPKDCKSRVQNAKIRVYATNYNVLRIMSGMGGLAYSN